MQDWCRPDDLPRRRSDTKQAATQNKRNRAELPQKTACPRFTPFRADFARAEPGHRLTGTGDERTLAPGRASKHPTRRQVTEGRTAAHERDRSLPGIAGIAGRGELARNRGGGAGRRGRWRRRPGRSPFRWRPGRRRARPRARRRSPALVHPAPFPGPHLLQLGPGLLHGLALVQEPGPGLGLLHPDHRLGGALPGRRHPLLDHPGGERAHRPAPGAPRPGEHAPERAGGHHRHAVDHGHPALWGPLRLLHGLRRLLRLGGGAPLLQPDQLPGHRAHLRPGRGLLHLHPARLAAGPELAHGHPGHHPDRHRPGHWPGLAELAGQLRGAGPSQRPGRVDPAPGGLAVPAGRLPAGLQHPGRGLRRRLHGRQRPAAGLQPAHPGHPHRCGAAPGQRGHAPGLASHRHCAGGLGGRGRHRGEHLPGHRPAFPGQPQRVRAGGALHPEQHRVHPPGLRPGLGAQPGL